SLWGCLLIILLSADFFIPMRQLGSFFHIAMNGMAASDKIFRLIDLEESETPSEEIPLAGKDIAINNLTFSYTENREILHGISLRFPENSFTAIVGESGCGKSTVASILMGRNKNYGGSVKLGRVELSDIIEEALMKNITYIGHNSYLFKGTVRDNLLMGNPSASDEELWIVLEKVKLSAFLKSEKGLDTELKEKGSNFSGGQCQRLALARAILHDSPIYIFDDATSNIDVESENDIMELIHTLAKTKTVILISHRLANVKNADNIYVLDKGDVIESGTHSELLEKQSHYHKLWTAQQKLENYTGKEKA
ncbi:MAG: ATP-binding cassette domain-containing protein, partial [Clostridia bacterium]|nr:ATP-binding cassette domain-containing protein [Clostridia bacterium]